jgi:glucose-6-phosphate 1-dehydrogenase
MKAADRLAPAILVVFGATGDLMARKIVPSLYHLRGQGGLPERLRVVGFGRRDWADSDLRRHVASILAERMPQAEPAEVEDFLSLFAYQRGEFGDPASYEATARLVARLEGEWGVCADKLFCLAAPPENYETIFRNLAGSGLTRGCGGQEGWTRVLVEKPFGDDLGTARKLEDLLASLFREEQIYRIDHYLAKEMLQGIMDFRFTNNLFEAEWGRRGIDRIDITLHEQLGVEKRGAFYDAVGALRDVGQNHLLQMLALVTMEQPASPGAGDIRAARAAAIEALHPFSPGEVAGQTFRAQHEGFRDIPGVPADSRTETYFKLRTVLRGPRWAGVPVTMQSGKRMGCACKHIEVTFRHPRPCLCASGNHPTNRIVFTLEPSNRIEIVFHAKRPGFDHEVEERRFSFFLYDRIDKTEYVEEYGKLLYDAFRGDQTLFVSTREAAAGWRFIDSVVDGWTRGLVPLETYHPDSSDIVRHADAVLAKRTGKGAVGVCGLGKMGAGVALNLVDHGWRVVGWNRRHVVAEALEKEGVEPAESLARLAESLAPPRVIWLMVPAGQPVDELLFGDGSRSGLIDLLGAGDTVIDGGNSRYADAAPRADRLAACGIRYLDCGTSGGPAGARHGACLMIGGEREVFEEVEPMLADVAAPFGYRLVGPHGAGHFVKMVHNGIEYGMMQAIAEGCSVLHEGPFELDLSAVADIYQQRSVVESRLVGWARDAFVQFGDDLEGVSGVVGHSGEGEWTIETARALGVDVPVIEAALAYRRRTAESPDYLGRVLTALRNAFGGHGLGPGGGPRR